MTGTETETRDRVSKTGTFFHPEFSSVEVPIKIPLAKINFVSYSLSSDVKSFSLQVPSVNSPEDVEVLSVLTLPSDRSLHTLSWSRSQ